MADSHAVTLSIHGLKSGKTLKIMRGHTSFVTQAIWSADQSRVLSCGSDGKIRVWDAKSTECERTFSPEQGSRADITITNLCAVPKVDGEFIVCTRSNTVFHMNQHGHVLRSFTHAKATGADFVQCTLSPGGKLVYCLAEDQRLYAFSFDSTDLVHTMQVHEREPIGLAHHPHKNLLATFSDDGMLVLWKALAAV